MPGDARVRLLTLKHKRGRYHITLFIRFNLK
jgi:hypothetical protein